MILFVVIIMLVLVALVAIGFTIRYIRRLQAEVKRQATVIAWCDAREVYFQNLYAASRVLLRSNSRDHVASIKQAGIVAQGKWVPSTVGIDMILTHFEMLVSSGDVVRQAADEIAAFERRNPNPEEPVRLPEAPFAPSEVVDTDVEQPRKTLGPVMDI